MGYLNKFNTPDIMKPLKYMETNQEMSIKKNLLQWRFPTVAGLGYLQSWTYPSVTEKGRKDTEGHSYSCSVLQKDSIHD